MKKQRQVNPFYVQKGYSPFWDKGNRNFFGDNGQIILILKPYYKRTI